MGDDKDKSERLVVLGGWVGDVSQSNTVFMETCPITGSEIPDLPLNISHGVATVIKSNQPSIVFCGGIEANTGASDACYEFLLTNNALDLQDAVFIKPDPWKQITSLRFKRGNAAIEILDSPNTVWVTGGRKSQRRVLDSTEILTRQEDGQWKVVAGPTLARSVAGHCTVRIDTPTIAWVEEPTVTIIVVVGGASFDKDTRKFVMTDKVEGYEWKFDEFIQKTDYPPLITGRSGHACTAFTDKSGNQMILVAGGQRATKDILDSVESLSFVPGSSWVEHSSLPRALTGAKFINKLGLPVLIGGTGLTADTYTGQQKVEDLIFSKDILVYSTEENNWKKTGEVIETVAYHVTLALNNDICVEFQDELDRDHRYECRMES